MLFELFTECTTLQGANILYQGGVWVLALSYLRLKVSTFFDDVVCHRMAHCVLIRCFLQAELRRGSFLVFIVTVRDTFEEGK